MGGSVRQEKSGREQLENGMTITPHLNHESAVNRNRARARYLKDVVSAEYGARRCLTCARSNHFDATDTGMYTEDAIAALPKSKDYIICSVHGDAMKGRLGGTCGGKDWTAR